MLEARNAAIKQTILSTAMLAIMMLVFYASANRTDIPQSWFLFSVIFVYFVASTIVLNKYNPELLIQRLKIRRKGSKTWDEVLVRASNLTALLIMPAVAGLDVGGVPVVEPRSAIRYRGRHFPNCLFGGH